MTSSGAASDLDNVSEPIGPEHLAAFAGLASDPTGIHTFERYVWQAKLTVRAWLGAFAGIGMLAVVCEHVEDLAIVEANRFRFAQH